MTARALARFPRTLPALAATVLLLGAGACASNDEEVSDVEVQVALEGSDGRADWQTIIAEANGEIIVMVDGQAADVATAQQLTAEQIATVEVSKRVEGDVERTEIRLVTRDAAAEGIAESPADPLGSLDDFTGLLIVDGVVTDLSALETLDPEQIAEVRVFKGDGAAERHDDPRAAEGVIEITTRGS